MDFQLQEKKLDTALLTPSYGSASQDAAIAAVYKLGKENEILREPAIEGLSSVDSYVAALFGDKSEKFLALKKYVADLKSIK